MALALGAALLASAACRRGDPVQSALDGVLAAAEKGDATRAARYFSARYADQQGWTQADVERTLRQYLTAYESLDLAVSRLDVSRGVRFARAKFRVDMSGTPRKVGGLDAWLPHKASYDFELELTEEEPGTYRITSASWKPAEG